MFLFASLLVCFLLCVLNNLKEGNVDFAYIIQLIDWVVIVLGVWVLLKGKKQSVRLIFSIVLKTIKY